MVEPPSFKVFKKKVDMVFHGVVPWAWWYLAEGWTLWSWKFFPSLMILWFYPFPKAQNILISYSSGPHILWFEGQVSLKWRKGASEMKPVIFSIPVTCFMTFEAPTGNQTSKGTALGPSIRESALKRPSLSHILSVYNFIHLGFHCAHGDRAGGTGMIDRRMNKTPLHVYSQSDDYNVHQRTEG